MQIRPERPCDTDTIRHLVTAAFAGASHASGTEAVIVDGLREAGALTVSLVAEQGGEIVGHVAFSPVLIDGRPGNWFGLGPVAVRPNRQGEGVGSALIRAGLAQLHDLGGQGCVVLGDPAYYRRFGFASHPRLWLGGVPPEYFQQLRFGAQQAAGQVTYHPAFSTG